MEIIQRFKAVPIGASTNNNEKRDRGKATKDELKGEWNPVNLHEIILGGSENSG